MPNEHGEYTDAETRSYKPEPCQQCDSPQKVAEWFRTNLNSLDEPRYIPGLTVCTNDRCLRNAG